MVNLSQEGVHNGLYKELLYRRRTMVFFSVCYSFYDKEGPNDTVIFLYFSIVAPFLSLCALWVHLVSFGERKNLVIKGTKRVTTETTMIPQLRERKDGRIRSEGGLLHHYLTLFRRGSSKFPVIVTRMSLPQAVTSNMIPLVSSKESKCQRKTFRVKG
jgi:hypothetical protein